MRAADLTRGQSITWHDSTFDEDRTADVTNVLDVGADTTGTDMVVVWVGWHSAPGLNCAPRQFYVPADHEFTTTTTERE